MISTIKDAFSPIRAWMRNHVLMTTVIGFLVLVAVGTFVFYLRYPFAYNDANFYAEDGKDFIKNLLDKGFLAGTLTAFNGYLIIGQYIVGCFGIILNFMFGHGFVTLPQFVAVASYMFLAVVCALPWLLLRKKLGLFLTVAFILLLWVTPFGGYDYAVIGTIGNLKFSFLFIAVILIVYRNDKELSPKNWQVIITDIILFVCVLTNIVVLAILPFALLRYKSEIVNLVKKFAVKNLLASVGFLSLAAVAVLSAVYLLVVYVHGIPKLPGYLDGPLDKSALLAVTYRSTVYGITTPFSPLLNDFISVILVIGLGIVLWWRKTSRQVMMVITVALIVNIVGFVANRPGVTELFAHYAEISTWPGHFFYAGTMITLLGIFYVLAEIAKTKWVKPVTLTIVVVIFPILFIFAGTSKVDPYVVTKQSNLKSQLTSACHVQKGENVTFYVYPTKEWFATYDKKTACL